MVKELMAQSYPPPPPAPLLGVAAMISHPPIPIERLSEHIEMLKAADNLKFSQEYESIEPGQQFTWDNSNLEVNKPKNRYANVIAYDHSRVILQPIDGVPGSDYVNANYMDGYRKQNAYIATQVSAGGFLTLPAESGHPQCRNYCVFCLNFCYEGP